MVRSKSSFSAWAGSKWCSTAWQALFLVWAVGVNVAYYRQFRDLAALYWERIWGGAGLLW